MIRADDSSDRPIWLTLPTLELAQLLFAIEYTSSRHSLQLDSHEAG